jgi:hypothetical protein
MKPRLTRQDHGFALRIWLEHKLPSYAKRYLDAALAGDEQQACSICCAAPNEYRGSIALAAYYLRVPNPAYQTIIRMVWNHDHQSLMTTARHDRRLIRRMMKAGKFEHPFSGSIVVFRGTAGMNLAKASKGLSWTLSREMACFFGFRYIVQGADDYRLAGNPVVLKASIDASDIVFWDNSLREQEVVLRRDISAELDPEPETWADTANKMIERSKAMEKARVEEYTAAKPLVLQEWDDWARKNLPPSQRASGTDGLIFFGYLQKQRPHLLKFETSGDGWTTVHGWLLLEGKIIRTEPP